MKPRPDSPSLRMDFPRACDPHWELTLRRSQLQQSLERLVKVLDQDIAHAQALKSKIEILERAAPALW